MISDEFEILSVADEEGNTEDFMLLDDFLFEGNRYVILSNGSFENEDEEAELLVMSVEDRGDEEYFETLEDDDLADRVAEYWLDHCTEDEDETIEL